MTDQQRPDEEDEEGHGRARLEDEASADDVQGHRRKFHLDPEASRDDVEGHARIRLEDQVSEDDVAGHRNVRRPL